MEIENKFVGFGNVTLHDSEGNEIEIPNCKCGQQATTFISGISAMQWICHQCAFGESNDVEIVFRLEGKI